MCVFGVNQVNLSNARRPDFQAADGTVIPASEAGRCDGLPTPITAARLSISSAP